MVPGPSPLRSRLWGNTKHDLQPCFTPSHPDLNPRPVHGQHRAAHHKSPKSHSSVVQLQNLPKPHFGCRGTAVGCSALRPPLTLSDQSFLFTFLIIYLIIYLWHPRRVIALNTLVFWLLPPWLMVNHCLWAHWRSRGKHIYIFI